MEHTPRGFFLNDYAADETISPVDGQTLIQRTERLAADQQLRLVPEPPIPVPAKGMELAAVNWVQKEDGRLRLVAMLREPGREELTIGFLRPDISREDVLTVVLSLLERGEAPDFGRDSWQLVRMQPMSPDEAAGWRRKRAQEEMIRSNKSGKK